MSLTNKHHGMINLIQERVKSNNASQVGSPANSSRTDTVILIEDIVPNVLFGLNQRVLTLGTNSTFHGVKDIPVGVHFVYAGAGVLSVRNGFWFVIEDGDERIHVRSWDSNNETLEDVSELESDEKRRKMVGIYSSFIYPFGTTWTKEMSNAQSEGHHARWTALTSCITSTLLSRITGHERNHWKVTSSDDVLDTPHMATNGAKATQTAITTDQNLYFSLEQGSKTFLNTATGRDRTQQALDTTAYIVDAIMNKCTEQDEDEIIGELQFSFLSGMLLGNIACQEQWSWTTKTLFRANELVRLRPIFVQKFIRTFHLQMQMNEHEIEGSIFDHDGSVESQLKANLTKFKARLSEHVDSNVDIEAVKQAFAELENFLEKEMCWELGSNYLRSGKFQLEDGEEVDAELSDFEDEDERGEYAPVVVEIEDDGTQRF